MYRPLLSVVGIFAVLLGFVLLCAPMVYLSLYIAAPTADMAFPAQRLSPAIIGLGALIWAARDLPAGPIPATFTLIAAFVWFGVAATGLFHFATGVATFGILVAALTEVILGALFLLASRQIRHG